MKKRITAFVLCILIMVSLLPPHAYASKDYGSNVGAYAQLNSYYADSTVIVHDGSSNFAITEAMMFDYTEFEAGLIFRITDCYLDSTNSALWYQVEAYRGNLPADMSDGYWIFQNYSDDASEEDTLTFVSVCEICGGVECQQTHLYCLACEKFGCELTHQFCGYCNDYDCGIDHLAQNKPAEAPVIPENPVLTEGAEVSITDASGDAVTDSFILGAGMKSSLSAWTDLEGEVSYQWQICVEDQWIDIQGQTEQGILVSPAMFLSVAEDGRAVIRCAVTGGEEVRTSGEIAVILADEPETAAFAMGSGGASQTEGDTELQEIYVVVQYVYSDGRTAATTDFAEIIPGNAYSHSYTLPTIPGYRATLNTHSYGDSVVLSDNELTMNFAAGELTEEYTILTVTFVPDFVSYTVIHYWQNVDNDNYTERERETIDNKYETGDVITDAQKTYPGFYNLLYETPTAAADGSTVIEVYYDRYYYLMKFELGEMGYGVDPIYARYGDGIEIGNPTRKGYTFLGWKLNGVGETIASANMPKTMPAENRTYVAQWQMEDSATVNVVIWGENADDEEYSYLGTEEITAKPGSSITWTEGGLICGMEEHAHGNDCDLGCGYAQEHTHTQENCFDLTCGMVIHTHNESCCTKAGEIHSAGKSCYGNVVGDPKDFFDIINGEETNGYIGEKMYIWGSGTGARYIYIDGTWYAYSGGVDIGGTAPTTCNGIHGHGDHTCSYCTQPEHSTHTNDCYEFACTIPEHTHNSGCVSCGKPEHSHSSSCYATTDLIESDLWEFESSETVTVAPDGTTVLNVKFKRKEKTLTFKYDYRSSRYNKTETITAKWGADISDEYVAIADDAGTFWAATDSNSGPYTNYFGVMPQTSATYYNRGKTGSDGKMTYYGESLDGEYVEMFTVEDVGGYTVTDEDRYEFEGFDYSHGTGNGKSCSGATFYYTRHRYAIEFYNPTDLLEKKTGVPFEANLGSYDFTPTPADAPDVYEPGSMKFAGWYLNPECTGEQYILADHTMPSAPKNGATALVLYAKWEPVEYKVNYYLSKGSLDRGETIPVEMARLIQEAITAGKITQKPVNDPYTDVFSEDIVKHGGHIPTPPDPEVSEGYDEIHPQTGYDFLGWFYINEDGEEAAFDPENMPVDKHLDLYAKWSSNVLCKYNVYFALDANADGVADKDTNGNTIYVADPISGSAIAGRTYTFTAKGGENLYDPEGDVNYREGYFPTAGSHSITINIRDEEGTGANSHTFLYRPKAAVPYTVRYVNKATGEKLFDDKVVSNNKNVVVTENFLYKQGFMPDAYQKTLVVTDGGENVITFYYTEDTDHALYVVNYYIQTLDDQLNHAGWTKYTDLQYTGDIGTQYTASAIAIDGFTLSTEYTNKYNTSDKINGMENTTLPAVVGALTADGKLTGTLTDKGMELNFYYTRNLYPYEFRYMLQGTATQLANPIFGKAGYDQTVTEAAQEIKKDLDGDGVMEDYRLYDPTETTKSIHIRQDGDPLNANEDVTQGQAKVNVATFYYVRCTQTMKVTKTVVNNSAYDAPDPNQEFIIEVLIHSTSGYHQASYAYSKSDGTSGTLSPEMARPNVLQFTLKAGQTITIDGLPTAEYTVSEQNLPQGYYATYTPQQDNKLTVDAPLEVTVTNTYDPAVLEITKMVDVEEEDTNTPEVDDFQFTIWFPDGVTGTFTYTVGSEKRTATVEGGKLTFTLKKDQTARFENIPTGSYTIEEKDYSANGYKSNFVLGGVAPLVERNDVSITVDRGDELKVSCKNAFPVGDLVIEKTVTKEFFGTAWNGDTFTFTVERTTADRPLIEGKKYKVELDGVEQDAMVEVDADGELQVEIEFTAADATTLQAEGASVTHILTILNLPAGTYKVTEAEKTQDKDADYVRVPASRVVDGLEIPATATASFTNQLTRPKGNLSLTKDLVKADGYTGELPEHTKFSFTFKATLQSPPNGTYTVEYSPAVFTEENGTTSDAPTTVEMEGGKFTLEIQAGQTVTIPNLPIDTYRITEATIPSYANQFALKKGGAWVKQPSESTDDGAMYLEVVVTTDEMTEVKCTNTYPVDRAELVLQKLVTKEYSRDTLPNDDFVFTVKLAEKDKEAYSYKVYNQDGSVYSNNTTTVDGDNAFRITLKAGQYAVVPDMPVCGYTVTESADPQHYNMSYQIYQTETSGTASKEVDTSGRMVASGNTGSVGRTFVAAKTDTVVFTNQYKKHLTNLTIDRNAAADPEQVFVYEVRNNTTGDTITVTVVGDSETTIFDLPYGDYTVTQRNDWSWRYGDVSQQVTLSENNNLEGQVAKVEFNGSASAKWLDGFSQLIRNICSGGGAG